MVNKCAPVIIPTLCRYEHFKRCIESLKRNSWAKYTDLYIGLDFPEKESHFEGYQKIKAYLDKGIDGFANVIIIKNDKNMGAIGNSLALSRAVSDKYDRYIFSEDDNEFSPNYIEYMNKCLDRYEKDEDILAVTGYKYPFPSKRMKGTVFTSNVYFAGFGYGTWNRKIIKAQGEMTAAFFCNKYKDLKFMRYFYRQGVNQYCNFVKAVLGYIPVLMEGTNVVPYDLPYGIYMAAKGKKMIFPTISKVRNWGYDGSGEHCEALAYDREKPVTHRNFGFECQELDEAGNFEIVEEKELSQQEMNDIVSGFFEVPRKEILRTKAAYCMSRMIGIRRMRRLIHGVQHKNGS